MTVDTEAALNRENAFVGYSERAPADGDQCGNRHSSCEEWAANGECDRKPGYMNSACSRACHTCGDALHGEPQPHDPSKPCSDCETLKLTTKHGGIAIKVRTDWSPNTCRAVLAEAAKPPPLQRRPNFYRSEKVPPEGAIDQFGGPGPPYALLQGHMPGLPKLAREFAPIVERGMVCLIGEGPAFFIAVGPHPEWGNGHTVWGQVEDMSTVDFIVDTLPVKHEEWGGTKVTVLEEHVEFALEIQH